MREEFVIMEVCDTYNLFKFTRSGVCLNWSDFCQRWSPSLRPNGIEDVPKTVGTFEEVLTKYKMLKELTEDEGSKHSVTFTFELPRSIKSIEVPSHTHNLGFIRMRVRGQY